MSNNLEIGLKLSGERYLISMMIRLKTMIIVKRDSSMKIIDHSSTIQYISIVQYNETFQYVKT